MGGEDPISSGSVSAGLRDAADPDCRDAYFRTHLLLRDLPARSDARPVRLAGQESEKEPLPQRLRDQRGDTEQSALQRARFVCGMPRHRFCARDYPSGSVLRLRQDCQLAFPTAVRHAEQWFGSIREPIRQLSFQRSRTMDAQRDNLCSGSPYAGRYRCVSLAKRTDVLQHHLPRGNDSQFLQPFLADARADGQREVQELLAMREKLQGGCHRLQSRNRRCHPLRGLRRLYRPVSFRRASLPATHNAQRDKGQWTMDNGQTGWFAPCVSNRRRSGDRSGCDGRDQDQSGRRFGRDRGEKDSPARNSHYSSGLRFGI